MTFSRANGMTTNTADTHIVLRFDFTAALYQSLVPMKPAVAPFVMMFEYRLSDTLQCLILSLSLIFAVSHTTAFFLFFFFVDDVMLHSLWAKSKLCTQSIRLLTLLLLTVITSTVQGTRERATTTTTVATITMNCISFYTVISIICTQFLKQICQYVVKIRNRRFEN